jgi:hypothetical protein
MEMAGRLLNTEGTEYTEKRGQALSIREHTSAAMFFRLRARMRLGRCANGEPVLRGQSLGEASEKAA